MSVGVPALDEDHRTLIGLINLLQRSIGDSEEFVAVSSVLSALGDYAAHHFAREEGMIRAAHCPHLDQHHRSHEGFEARVALLKARYQEQPSPARARECLAFLNDWLVNHICTTDMGYRAWLVGLPEVQREGAALPLAKPKGGRDLRQLEILVVDDNEAFCEILAAILGSVGIGRLTLMHDVASAKQALAGQAVDMLICDWHVGAENGLDLVKWVRQGPPNLATLPILMLSGHERLVNRDLALLAGANEFMEKPVTARGLLICLSRLAGRG